jgi:phospholipid transport system substrate-binding protein
MNRFFRAAILSTALTASFAGTAAYADKATEAYVQKNANMALESLNSPNLTAAERRAEFNTLMGQFTDIDLIAMRVLGKYYRQFSSQEKEAFTAAFREYALATYEAELDKYRGNELEVVSSQDNAPTSSTKVDSVVTTVIEMPDPSKNLTVLWRVVEFQPDSKYTEVFGSGYKVTDVALDLEGGRIWLAQNQREQFLSILDRSNGSAADLIAKVKEMTARLNQEAEQRRQSAALSGAGGQPAAQAG